jgi:hypothetical protein
VEVLGELLDGTEIAADGGRRIVTALKFVKHALTKWGHGKILL